MTELKTLKDLPKESYYSEEGYTAIKDLKEEAIKWIKELPTESLFMEEYWIIKWITHFFNLTEEDLK